MNLLQIIAYNRRTVGVLIVFCLTSFCHAQSTSSNVRDTAQMLVSWGYKYQMGINCDVNLQKAKAYYIAAANRHSSDGYLRLGMMYLHGDGVGQRIDSAYRCFLQAARMRNYQAYCQLGQLYRSGNGVKQNFRKAYALYKTAADSGHLVNGYYLTGYMFYKGFGVNQSYQKAIRYFRKGAAMNDAGCTYMLGYCQMYGYGVPQNMDSTKVYFGKAMMQGNRWVNGWVEFMAQRNALDSIKQHSQKPFASLTDVKKRRMQAGKMPQTGMTLDADSLQGTWKGKVYEYDWSRTIVENEDDMQLDLQKDGEKLTGKLYQNGVLLTEFSAITLPRVWAVVSQTPHDTLYKVKFEVRGLICKVTQKGNSTTLTGNIIRYNYTTNEPARPLYFILDKEVTASDGNSASLTPDTTFVIQRIYPNPFNSQLMVDFTVLKTDNVQFRIYTPNGVNLYNSGSKHYLPGAYTVILTPELSSGPYRLEARGRQFVWSRNVLHQ